MSAPIHKPGMDQDHYRWSPISSRPPLSWPGGKPVALNVVILAEHVELFPPEGSSAVRLPAGIMGNFFPFPNMPMLTIREYGHRVGIFRILDILEQLAIPPTVAIDAMTAERYPVMVAELTRRKAEFVAHGISASQMISEQMNEAEERRYISGTMERLKTATGSNIEGWMSPEQSESSRTPQMLDEAGLGYVLDWPNDEQPYYMNTPARLVSVPTAFELDDAQYLTVRKASVADYANDIVDAFDCLASDALATGKGRNLTLVVRPWIVGQPYRIGAFEAALKRIVATEKVWSARTGEIVSAFRQTHA